MAKGRQHLSNNLSKLCPYMVFVKPLKRHSCSFDGKLVTLSASLKKVLMRKQLLRHFSLNPNLRCEADTALCPEGSSWPPVG